MVVIEPVVALLTLDSRAIGVALVPVERGAYVGEVVPPMDGPVDTGPVGRPSRGAAPYASVAPARAVGVAVIRVKALGVEEPPPAASPFGATTPLP